jgi:hypothetical protein
MLSSSLTRDSSMLRKTLVASAISLSLANIASAATINVGPINCSLIDAIFSADQDISVGLCTHGSGNDTIVLQPNSIHTLTVVNSSATNRGDNGLPLISTNITIQGNGANITRADGAPEFRIFYVAGSGSLTLNDATVSNGSTLDEGGAILGFGTVTLNRVIVSDNFAKYGGGIYAREPLNIADSSILQNTASQNGGGVNTYDTLVTIDKSTIANNIARVGGGIAVRQGSLDLTNTTVSGNTATEDGSYGSGGAISKSGAEVTIVNSTITNNSAGFSAIRTSGSPILVSNSVIANDAVDLDCQLPITDSGNNWFGDSSCNAVASGDPRLGPLKANGGLTLTHSPKAGSGVIDAGDDATCAAAPIENLDQRSELRPVGDHCDIGAVEFTDDGSFFVIPLGNGKTVVVPL